MLSACWWAWWWPTSSPTQSDAMPSGEDIDDDGPAARPAHAGAMKLLRTAGHHPARVYHVWSAGESEAGVDTILYTSQDGVCMTALLHFDTDAASVQILEVSEGW